MAVKNTGARRKARPSCGCGCGQAPAETTRLRKAQCPGCGYVIRVTREWIGHGLPECACGVTFSAPCLFDRAQLPDDEGREAWSEVEGRRIEFLIRSERSKKGAAHRRRCKADGCGSWLAKGALYCRAHAGLDLPF